MNFFMISTRWQMMNDVYVRRYPFHLVLAQYLYDDPEWVAYLKQFQTLHDKRIILDNGAYENEIIDSAKYATLANELNPWCVVLPDCYNIGSQASWEMAEAFLPLLHVPCQRMLCPQGVSKEDVLMGFDHAVNTVKLNPKQYMLGLGKGYLHWGTTETDRLTFLKDVLQVPNTTNYRLHMFGARDIPTTHFANFSNVIGIDTFKPARCAAGCAYYPGFLRKKGISDIKHNFNKPTNHAMLYMNILNFMEGYGIQNDIDTCTKLCSG